MDTYVEWDYLWNQLRSVEHTSDEGLDLIDRIKSLPYFPNNYEWEEDTIEFDIIKSRESFSFG